MPLDAVGWVPVNPSSSGGSQPLQIRSYRAWLIGAHSGPGSLTRIIIFYWCHTLSGNHFGFSSGVLLYFSIPLFHIFKQMSSAFISFIASCHQLLPLLNAPQMCLRVRPSTPSNICPWNALKWAFERALNVLRCIPSTHLQTCLQARLQRLSPSDTSPQHALKCALNTPSNAPLRAPLASSEAQMHPLNAPSNTSPKCAFKHALKSQCPHNIKDM